MRKKTGRSLKKFLSLLLTLSMVLGMLPTFAMAAPGDTIIVGDNNDGLLRTYVTYVEPAADAATVQMKVKIWAQAAADRNDYKNNYNDSWAVDITDGNGTKHTLGPFAPALTRKTAEIALWTEGLTGWVLSDSKKPTVSSGSCGYSGNPNLSEYYNYSGSREVTSTGSFTWTIDVPVNPGENEIKFEAKHSDDSGFGTKYATIVVPFTVTYDDGVTEAPAVTGLPANGTQTAAFTPEVPSREGYTFLGWDTGSDGVADYAPGAAVTPGFGLALTAVWAKSLDFTITAGDIGTGEPLHEGNYALEVKVVSGGAMIEDAVKTKAAALAKEKSKLDYFTADVLYNGTPVSGAVLSKAVNVPVSGLSLPEGATAKIYHWNGIELEEVTDVTVGAGGTISFETNKFSPFAVLVNPVTVTFVDKNGYIVDEKTVESGSKVNLISPPAADAGFTFNGWQDVATSNKISGTFFNPLVDTTLKATYKAGSSAGTTWEVTYYVDGKVYQTLEVADGGKATDLYVPGVAQWYSDESCTTLFDFTATISAATSIYAKSAAAGDGKHTVTFYNGYTADAAPDASMLESIVKVDDGATVTAPVVTKAGMVFKGWNKWTDDVTVDTYIQADELDAFALNTPITEDTILIAEWETAPTYYTVTFKANGSGVYDLPEAYTVLATAALGAAPAAPGRDGYTFKGWKTAADGTGDAYAADYVPTDDVVFYAQWEKVIPQYVVTYPTSAPTGLTLSKTGAQAAVKEGTTETFTVTLGTGYNAETLVVTANGVELAPVAVADNVYTYSFIVNAATSVAVLAPGKLTYTVVMPESDTFTAEFTDHTTSKVLKYGDTYSFTVTPADGYTIDKVYVNGNEVTATSGVYGPFTVTGEQSILVTVNKVVFYTVTYVVDGAQLTTRQVQSGTAVNTLGSVGIPTKEGYTPSVWYNDAAMTDTGKVSTLEDTVVVSGDMELYAKYNPNTYVITYNANGGTPTPDAQTKKHGEALNLSTTIPAKDGHTFLGWGIGANPTTAVYQPGDQYSNNEAVTLVAVWQKNTFTVTLPSGTGYTVSSAMSNVVEYNGSYTFTVKVDRAYSTTAPVVVWTKADGTGGETLTNPTATVNSDNSKSYTYTLSDIKEDRVVSVTVVQNLTYTVTFYTLTNDTTPVLAVYQTQQVEDTFRVDQPADPVMEGYTFQGWYLWTDDGDGVVEDTELATTQYSFDTAVSGPMKLVGKMTKNTYVVTLAAEGAGWTDDFVDPPGTPATTAETITVDHGTSVKFQVKVLEGYDASKMQVGVNGKLWAANSIAADDNDTVYTYIIPAVTETTSITVVGVERKTVTITYNDNARDDVSGMPGQQVVKYYLAGASDNDKIIKQYPVRTGYEFLGWCTDSAYTGTGAVPAGETYYAKAAIEAGAYSVFTKDTTLYAIWEAKEVTVELTFSDILGATGEWEKDAVLKETFNLVATFNQPVIGDVTFKKTTIDGEEVTLGTVAINGGKSVTLKDVEAGSYKNVATPSEEYWVEFMADVDEGYSDAVSAPKTLLINSRALSWTLVANGNKLIIHEGNTVGGTSVDSMTAGQTYTLELPNVQELNAQTYMAIDGTIEAGKQYRVKWQYRETAKSDWVTIQEDGGDTYLVTSEFSGYAFRALVEPMDAPFTKAATYKANTVNSWADLIDDAYAQYLVTQPTADTVRQETETSLEILGAADEGGDVVINGDDTVFSVIGAHKAQFEGDKVTLKATVVDTATTEGVPSVGFVNFYLNGEPTPLNDAPIAVGANGVATFEWTTSAYTGSDPTAAKDSYTAKYLENDTYEDSDSAAAVVYIKSTTIQTPVIDEIDASDAVIGSTGYTADLDGLLAGVKHTFKLRTGNTAADYSVVALDGRTVAETDYTIKWYAEHIVDDNKTGDTDSGATFVTTQNMKGDKFYVELIAQNNMDVGATSKKAIIGKKQDVKVTVTASDEIASTAEVDVYQLNPITLTAVVEAAETDASMKPTGTVTFYYSVDGTNWTQVGETTDLAVVAGAVTASIETDKLPVTDGTNTVEEVTIAALYSGDDAFNAIADQTDTKIEEEEVVVYSSVVYVTDIENTTTAGSDKSHGIYITVEGGLVLANTPKVKLMLSDIYTLDYADANAETLAKLAFGSTADYTVQWQKLSDAAAYADKYDDDETPWSDPIGTGVTCEIDVEDGAAYRAVITVNNTPIAKGSYTEVDQGTVGTKDIKDGKKVYYSNILVASDAPATVTVNVNTSNTDDGYEGIVEGETVTVHTFTAGATGTTPISELTMVIKAKDVVGVAADTVVDKQVKTDVNGHVSFDWAAAKPGYYTMTLTAKFTNGYSDKTITRELIVRDDAYSFTVSGTTATYNGKVQGLTVSVADMGIESDLAQDSVVVYYYDESGKQVEPTQAGTYTTKIRLQESAYWTELVDTNYTLTINPRDVSIVDLVAQAKIYDGTTDVNLQEIVLGDAKTLANGAVDPAYKTGVINGDSVYAVGTGILSGATAGTQTLKWVDGSVELKGKDADNYNLVAGTYTGETINVQRSQVQGEIAAATYKYTGSNIQVNKATEIYLIDQAGDRLADDAIDVTYYYHSGDGVEIVPAMNKLGMYTVVARPEQNNYKGGAAQTVYVVEGAGNGATANDDYTSALIDITNTVELFGAAGNKGIVATATKGTAVVEYNVGGAWTATAPTDAGRYLVKVTAKENSVVIGTAYGLYTVVKTYPDYTVTAADANYNSAQYAESNVNVAAFPVGTYFTFTGGTIQGVAYEAPTEVGTYVITAHVPETDDTVAHEFSDTFKIKPIDLKITADSLQRYQYGAYPDLTASFEGLATEGVADDTSLRDVQIQPELIFAAGYTNNAADQVGNNYEVKAAAALARNYNVSYESGNISVTRDDPKPVLAIRGMSQSTVVPDTYDAIAYYGDKIQLYAYGTQNAAKTIENGSSILTWSVSGNATISSDGLLEITGVGDVIVTLKRGQDGAKQISTTLKIDARKQEVKVVVPAEDLVYTGNPETYTNSAMSTVNAMLEPVTMTKALIVANDSRTNVGSQIVTGKVNDTVGSEEPLYQSETYGGLFTINDAEITVAPKAVSTTYGTAATMSNAYNTGYTEVDRVSGGTAALTNAVVASIADAYNNLDVGTYEILVAGTENMNYNVKYTTDPAADDVTVGALDLPVGTGAINGTEGMTSGSVKPAGKYPVDGKEVSASWTLTKDTMRMYGQPNWVMLYDLDALISGDSLADLANLDLTQDLVNYALGIDADANLAYDTKTLMAGKTEDDYMIEPKTSEIVFGNYDEEYLTAKGKQNIYQRPVTLELYNGTDTLDVLFSDVNGLSDAQRSEYLRDLIVMNLDVQEYNESGTMVGGLATLLDHNADDLKYELSYTYNASGFALQIRAIENYWSEWYNIQINVVKEKYRVEYNYFGATSSTVTLYHVDLDTGVETAEHLTSGDLMCKIFVRTEDDSYIGESPVVNVKMIPTSVPGQYTVTYPRLVGKYKMFAIAEGGIGYTIVNGIQ